MLIASVNSCNRIIQAHIWYTKIGDPIISFIFNTVAIETSYNNETSITVDNKHVKQKIVFSHTASRL